MLGTAMRTVRSPVLVCARIHGRGSLKVAADPVASVHEFVIKDSSTDHLVSVCYVLLDHVRSSE